MAEQSSDSWTQLKSQALNELQSSSPLTRIPFIKKFSSEAVKEGMFRLFVFRSVLKN
jgi:hypothetical protein